MPQNRPFHFVRASHGEQNSLLCYREVDEVSAFTTAVAPSETEGASLDAGQSRAER